MITLRQWLYSGLLMLFSMTASAKPVIEVITSDRYPVTGVQSALNQGYAVQIYNLNDGKKLVKRLAGTLPPNQTAAKQKLENTLHNMGQQAVQAAFMKAFKAQQLAAQYGLDRYPAIVFEHGRSVIYGVTDLNAALKRYHRNKITE